MSQAVPRPPSSPPQPHQPSLCAWSHCPDLTAILHVRVRGCSAKCTCTAGSNLRLPETRGNVSTGTGAGEKSLQPGHMPQGRARGSPHTGLAAVTSKMCCSAHGSPSPQCLCPPQRWSPACGSRRLCRQQSHWYLWWATWKWDSRLCKLVLNFDWMIDCF